MGTHPLAMRLLLAAFLATITLGALAVFVNDTEAGTVVGFTVNSSSDLSDAIAGDGVCDTVIGEPRICGMRAALEEANALNGPNDINFSAANTVLGADLPDITERINIDASTNPDGFNINAAGAVDDGLVLALGSSGSTIRGLDIENAPGNGLLICGGAFHTIGGDPDEGVAPAGQGNIFRDSGANGILVMGLGGPGACDAALGSLGGHMIWGNRVGTTPLGTAVDDDGSGDFQGNAGAGINIDGGSGPDIWIGGGEKMPNEKEPAGDPPPGWGNLISGNDGNGITFGGGTPDAYIYGNWIGLGVLGNATDEFANEGNGVFLANFDATAMVVNNKIAGGGINPIGNPGNNGILVESDGNTVLGNCIGFDHTCNSSSGGFSEEGILIFCARDNNLGDGTEAGRNVIGNTGEEGVEFDTGGECVNPADNVVNGNFIGFGKDGETNATIHSDCVRLTLEPNSVQVLNNLIGNCEERGIAVTGDDHLIQGNDIGRGTDPDSPDPLNNYCISIDGSSNEILDNVAANCDTDAPDASVQITAGSFNSIVGNDITSPIGEDVVDIEGGIGNLVASQTFRMIVPGDGDLPIDIDDDGSTVNDEGDADGGTNLLHNYPTFPPVSPTDGCARGSAGPFDTVRIYSKTVDGLNVTYNRIGEGDANVAGDFTICDLDDNAEEIVVVGTATTTVASTLDAGCALNCTSEFSVTEQIVGAGEPAATATPTITPTSEATDTPVATETPVATDTPVPPESTPAATDTTTPEKLCGDANMDGETNSVDASLVLQLKAGLISSLVNASSGDVNGDGSLTAVDAAVILQFTAGLIGEDALNCG